MGHPDFRVKAKIFATLGYPDAGFGMVKLTPEQQEARRPGRARGVRTREGRLGPEGRDAGTAARREDEEPRARAHARLAQRRAGRAREASGSEAEGEADPDGTPGR